MTRMRRNVLASLSLALSALNSCSHTMPRPEAKPQPSPEAVEAPKTLSSRAESAWGKRDDRASLDMAIDSWEQMLAANPNDAATAVSLSRAYFFLGDGIQDQAGDTEGMTKSLEKGANAAEIALRAECGQCANDLHDGKDVQGAVAKAGPKAVGALFWYANNLGRWASAKGMGAQIANKDRIDSAMRRVLALDETYYYGGVHRYLGTFYARAPSFAGGDLRKSQEHFDKAQKISPHYLGTKILCAETLAVAQKDRALFDRLVGEVQAADVGTVSDIAPEQRIEKARAQELAQRAPKLF